MAGVMYGIGVGPGDPGLMTLRAAERLKTCSVIAIPHESKEQCTAYQIARAAVPEIEQKECLYLPMPMTKNPEVLKQSHDQAAGMVASYLDRDEDVGFITLGDVSIYSTCGYLLERLWQKGYETSLESGVPSFCAAAAKLGDVLVSGAEELHIIPASYQVRDALKLSGVKVLMKAGKQMKEVKEEIRKAGASAVMVENCGMAGERIYKNLDEIPDEPGYYSLLIVR